MTKFFILDDSNNVIPATEAEWESFHSKRYIVAKTIIGSGRGAVEIETSFSGTHEEDEEEQPELFRTWYFQDADDGVEDDYDTWEAAKAGHEVVVARWLKLFPDAQRIDAKPTELAEA
jgi:hypothetical protein